MSSSQRTELQTHSSSAHLLIKARDNPETLPPVPNNSVSDNLSEECGQKDFKGLLKQISGCIFLIMFTLTTLWSKSDGGTDRNASTKKKSGSRGATLKKRWKIFLGVFLLCFMLGGQALLYSSLSWAMLQESMNYNHNGTAWCPGGDPAADGKNGLTATGAQVMTFVAVIVILLVQITFDWMKTGDKFRKFIGHVYTDVTDDYLTPVTVTDDHPTCKGLTAEEALRRLRYKHYAANFVDFYFHVLSTAVVYIMTIAALFFMSTVGRMATTALALMFLEQLDDTAQNELLDQTDLSSEMYAAANRPQKKREMSWMVCIPEDKKGLVAMVALIIGYLFFALCYIFIFGVAIFSLIWVARGCKPGTANAMDFF